MPKNILKCIHFFQQRLAFCGLATLKIIAFASDFYKSLQRPFLKVRLKKWFALDWDCSHIGFSYLALSSIQTSMLQTEDTKQTNKRTMAFWRPCNQLWAQLGAKPGLVDSILLEIGRWMGLSGILLPLAGCWCQRWHWPPLKLHSVCLQRG